MKAENRKPKTESNPRSESRIRWSKLPESKGLVFGIRPSFGFRNPACGFTLVEIMVVVAILAIVLAMGIPSIYHAMNKDPMRQSIADVMEACSQARALAILNGKPTQLVFHPTEGSFEVQGGGGARRGPPKMPGHGKKSGSSWTLDRGVIVEMLDINLMPFADEERAVVTFQPDGTCDEFLMILRADKVGQRGISLEYTTGLASVLNEKDLQQLRAGRL